MAFNEAAASERSRRTLCRYVETLNEARTQVQVYFSIP